MDSVLTQGRRRRRGSEEQLSSASSLDDLSDDLLIRILLRLPTTKSATVSKLVSKRWYCLISDSRFVNEFTRRHDNIRFSTVLFVCANHPQQPILIPRVTFTLDFLPVERQFVSVLASCGDLLLCQAEKKSCFRFTDNYVCNPHTKKWLLLPPPPADLVRDLFGLIYEPNYEPCVQGLNECRFRAVFISQSWGAYSLLMWIYCSETRQWNYHVQKDYEGHKIGSNIVPFNGKLYWHNYRDVVAYDPFSNERVLIDGSDPEGFNNHICNRMVSISLGICQRGYLRVMQLVNFHPLGKDQVNYLTVWELCTETRRLNVKHGIFLVRQPETGGILQVWRRKIDVDSERVVIVIQGPRTLAFHPDREDLIYLVVGFHHIITCDITNGKLEVPPGKLPFRKRKTRLC